MFYRRATWCISASISDYYQSVLYVAVKPGIFRLAGASRILYLAYF
jgi:hypothetical protein